MTKKIHCGLLLLKDGLLKELKLPEGGGVRDCILSHIDMGFDEIHDKLRELYEIDPTNRNSKLYDFKLRELDTNRYRTFFEYVHQNGLKFRGTLLYLCISADNQSSFSFSSPTPDRTRTTTQVTRQIPQVEADSSTSPEMLQEYNNPSSDYKPSPESLLNNQIVENLRISSTTSFSNYSFEKSLNEFVDYVRNIVRQYHHENVFIQLFEHLCTLQGLSSITLDRLKQQIQSIGEHEKQFFHDALEKIEKLLRSIRALIELNRMRISHIDQQSIIIDSFNQFQLNFNILHDQWNNNSTNNRRNISNSSTNHTNDRAPSRSVSSTHHSPRSSSSSRNYSSRNHTNDTAPTTTTTTSNSSSKNYSSDQATSRNHTSGAAPTAYNSSSTNYSSDRTSSRNYPADTTSRSVSSNNRPATTTSRNHTTDAASTTSNSYSRNYSVDPKPSNSFSSRNRSNERASISSRHHSEKKSRTLSASPHHHHYHHHHRSPRTTTEHGNRDEKDSLFRNLYKSLYDLSSVLYNLSFRSFNEFVAKYLNEIKLCQSNLLLSEKQSIDQAIDIIIHIEQRLSDRIQHERYHASPYKISRQLEESFDKVLDSIKQLLNNFENYKSKINSTKRPRRTRWSPPDEPSTNVQEQTETKPSIHCNPPESRRNDNDDDDDDQSSEASHSSFGDEVLMEVARDAFERMPNRHK